MRSIESMKVLTQLEREAYAYIVVAGLKTSRAAELMGLTSVSVSQFVESAKRKIHEKEQGDMVVEMVTKTLSQQAAKRTTYLILKEQGLPIPPELEGFGNDDTE